MNGSCRQRDFFWGAIVGGTIATLTALLFTTKKGKQLQRHLANIYGEAEDAVTGIISDAQEKLEEGVEHATKKGAHKSRHDDHHKDSK